MSTPITVLAVDDNEAHRYFICRTLEQAGYRAIPVSHGQLAVEKAHELPALVVLDVHLPDMDGFEVCRRIKADPETKDIPVVMFSGIAQNGSAVNDALQIGAAGFLFFPMAPDQLLVVVEGALAKASAQNTSQQKSTR